HRRGPIEATPTAACLSAYRSLPRLHRRGPIEARPRSRLSRKTIRLFHGFIAVAPLKLRGDLDAEDGLAPLPRLHRRGPIEAPYALWFLAYWQPLPRLHRRGPIEASAVALGPVVVYDSSTASSPWPH